MKNSIFTKATVFGLSIAILASLTVGCGTKSETSSTQTTTVVEATKAPEAPVDIRWCRTGNEQDPQKDRILLELQKRTNTKLEIVNVAWDQFPNKINIMMSSGENLDIVNTDPGTTVAEWAKNGLIYSYDDYLASGKYPLMNAVINAEVFAGLKVDGKAYIKPLPLVPNQIGFLIRQDWLDNVGMKIPTNLDELYAVMKAFKNNDPDKNGKDDTYGWYAEGSTWFSHYTQFIQRAFAVNANSKDGWILNPDGTVSSWAVSQGAKDALMYFKKMSDDGLINKDWAVLKHEDTAYNTRFQKGEYGIVLTTNAAVTEKEMATIDPKCKLEFLAPISGYKDVTANSGFTGGFWWGNVVPKTSKSPEKAMELMEYTMTEEGRELTQWGIQGIHFTDVKVEDGKKIYTVNKAECDKDWDTKKNGYSYPLTWGNMNYSENIYIPFKENNYNFDKAYKNLVICLDSENAGSRFTNMYAMIAKDSKPGPIVNNFDKKLKGDEKKLGDISIQGWTQCLLGKGDFETIWTGYVDKWMKAGGDTITKAANEFYTSNK